MVSDTGVGIPKAAKKRMFEAFAQADPSIQRRFGGTGLGLSITKKLVDMMGGLISFESVEGKGTTFKVELRFPAGDEIPLVESSDVPGQKRAGQTDFSKNRILVADDNPTNQLLIKGYLHKLGCNFHIVANGQEVLDAMREAKFDLILMDCQMPEMDGYQATKIIRSSSGFPNQIPILALTANAVKGDEKKCFEAGMNEHITKPVSLKELTRRLDQYLGDNDHTKSQDNTQENKKTLILHNSKFDSDIFDDLIESIGLDSMNQLIGSYKSSTISQLELIQKYLNSGDLESLSGSAHKLKPTAYLLGTHFLGDLYQEIEMYKENETAFDPISLYQKLKNETQYAFEQYEKRIQNLGIKIQTPQNFKFGEGIKKIAFVEDDPSFHMIFNFLVKKTPGLECQIFENGKNTCESLPSFSPDLILLDNQLPDMNGMEILERLKTKMGAELPPVIFVTAENDQKILDQMQNSSAFGILKKPFAPAQLFEQIEGLLENPKKAS